MTKVNYSNLVSKPRENVIDLISDSSNVADPISSSAEFRKWIYSRTPDVKSGNFSGYPFIIVSACKFDPDETGNERRKFVSWTIDLEVISSDRGYGNNDGKGLSHNDAITDDILQTFLDYTNRGTLRNYGMSFSRPVVSDIIVVQMQNELVYRRIITLSFSERLKISV